MGRVGEEGVEIGPIWARVWEEGVEIGPIWGRVEEEGGKGRSYMGYGWGGRGSDMAYMG